MPNPQTEPDHAAALLSGWETALDVVPVAWLDRTFAAAIRAHRGPLLITAGDVLTAWDGLLTERQQARIGTDPQLSAGPIRVCPRCAGQGWLVDRATGTPGHRDLYQCPDCSGLAPSPHRGPEDYTVGALLVVLGEWCAEHRDDPPFPSRLGYALACKGASAPPYDLRRLLDSTGGATLYNALLALGIAVEPPPAPGTHDPRSIGAALEIL